MPAAHLAPCARLSSASKPSDISDARSMRARGKPARPAQCMPCDFGHEPYGNKIAHTKYVSIFDSSVGDNEVAVEPRT